MGNAVGIKYHVCYFTDW